MPSGAGETLANKEQATEVRPNLALLIDLIRRLSPRILKGSDDYPYHRPRACVRCGTPVKRSDLPSDPDCYSYMGNKVYIGVSQLSVVLQICRTFQL
ncbi:hypothetical protein AKJ16_DCAP27285 [Drosera capensis]